MLKHPSFIFNRAAALRRAALSSWLAVGMVMPALAAGPDDKDGAASSWGLGLAAVSAQKPYAGMAREDRLLPMVSYENRWVRVFGPGLEIKLPHLDLGNTQQLHFSLMARYDGSGYEASDAAILSGMDKRKSGFWAGAKASWRTDVVNLAAEWAADASGHSKGQRVGLHLEKTWMLGRQVMLTPRVGASWYDKKYVDYYYGVRSAEATTGRAAYAGRSARNSELGLRSMYLFDRQQSMFLDLGLTRLARPIQDSPLVDRASDSRLFMGYLYRF